uniref:Uncharacterized protein n=1 Tax=Arundo donax TaxID=35708 RepID=A0A0A8Y479_ARUDO
MYKVVSSFILVAKRASELIKTKYNANHVLLEIIAWKCEKDRIKGIAIGPKYYANSHRNKIYICFCFLLGR